MSKHQLRLVRGELSSPQVDQALTAFYAYVLPCLMNSQHSVSRKDQELFISSLIAEYAIK